MPKISALKFETSEHVSALSYSLMLIFKMRRRKRLSCDVMTWRPEFESGQFLPKKFPALTTFRAFTLFSNSAWDRGGHLGPFYFVFSLTNLAP